MKDHRIYWAVLSFAMSLLILHPWSASSAALTVWTTLGTDRVGLHEMPRTTHSPKIAAAKGETESFQIAIHSQSAPLTNVKVSVSDLFSASKAVISKQSIDLFREHYLYLDRPSALQSRSSNSSLGKGWYPDGLIPFRSEFGIAANAVLKGNGFTVESQTNQVIWVDVNIPHNAEAGDYQASYLVSSDQGNFSGKFQVKVWDFNLPKHPTLKSEFGLTENPGKQGAVELLKHRIDPDLPSAAHHLETSLIQNWGKQSGRLPFFSGADAHTDKIKPPPSVATIRSSIQRRDSRLKLYARFVDEIDAHTHLIPAVKQWSMNFHQAGASVVAAMVPRADLFDDGHGEGRSAIDAWAVLPVQYDRYLNLINQARGKGDQIWFYTALAQDPYSPKWLLDMSPINYRIGQGFISQSLGIDGLLYWRVDDWTDEPWSSVSQVYDKGHWFAGEGILVYPGAPVGIKGIVPSMRLKWIRDGIDDYDYIELLSDLQGTDRTLAMSRKVGSNWSNWTKDIYLLESTRWEMGNLIEQLTIEKRNGTHSAS